MPDTPPASSMSSKPRGKRIVLAAAALVVGLAAVVVGLRWRADRAGEPVDPRLTSTPYRNVRPEVRYVGDQVCASCHAEIAETYSRHPMGRALAPIAEATPIERFDVKAGNPFVAFDLHFGFERRDQRLI